MGMEIMVMFNVSTDLDMANRAQGRRVDIVLNEREEAAEERSQCMQLRYPPHYVLVSMNCT